VIDAADHIANGGECQFFENVNFPDSDRCPDLHFCEVPTTVGELGAAYIASGVDGLVKPLSFAEHQLPGRVIGVVYSASLVTGVFLIYAAFFGLFAYSEIPQNLGGGHPRLVRILIDSADSTDLQAVGFSFSTQTSISDPVQLLIDSDKEYVFLVADTSARVSRELVKAVVYEPIH
jgi:hypothetical protein